MSVSLYQTSIPALMRSLLALRDILEKSRVHAAQSQVDPQHLLNASLAPDMYGFADQVDLMCRHARGIAVRLGKLDEPLFEESLCERGSIVDLEELIDRAISLLARVVPEDFEANRERSIEFNLGALHFASTGQQYLSDFALPNFYFHYAIAYGILRTNGVPIGKADFLGRVGHFVSRH